MGNVQIDEQIAVKESLPKLDKPRLYQVILLNDDYTPMDFVIIVLQRFFSMSVEQANQVMLQVHTEGRGLCGTYTRDVAETKMLQTNDYARGHQHPLLCTIQPVS